MASFNKKTNRSVAVAVPHQVRRIVQSVPDTVNKAGGQAFSQSAEYKLAFLLLTSFVEDQFYRTKAQTVVELQTAVANVSPLFAAKAAIFARNEYGMRSITHVTAATIAKNVKGETWTKSFYNKVVRRVDDAAEILAAYLHLYGKPIPNSLKKGLALGLSKFDRYQLAKYKGENKAVSLVDLFNIVHPKPNAENAQAFKDLIEGNLASTDTWEAEISAAGQEGGTEAEKAARKTEAWRDLVVNKKIGYFALLRNLRNILKTGDEEVIKAACETLKNEKLIKNSLVLPFRFMTAGFELAQTGVDKNTRIVLSAVGDAMEIALNNVPVFEGETLIALDCSGSMMGTGPRAPSEIGALFAAAIAKSNNADLLLFADTANYINVSLTDSLATVTNSIKAKFKSGGTNFNSIFQTANKKYDRIIILSDMQAWVGHYAPLKSFGEYCASKKASPKIYCFDLQGLGTLQFPEKHVYQLSGFSDKTMDLMKVLEEDNDALIKQINAIEL